MSKGTSSNLFTVQTPPNEKWIKSLNEPCGVMDQCGPESFVQDGDKSMRQIRTFLQSQHRQCLAS